MGSASELAGRHRADREGVYIGLHQVVDGRKDGLVSLQPSLALECRRDDSHAEMTLTASGPSVTLVEMALVFHVQILGVEAFFQGGSYGFNSLFVQGSTFRNGLTVTL